MQIRRAIKRMGVFLNRWHWLRKAGGSEIIEFAVSMPILMVLVVGVYDFGSAFTLKHRLEAAAREGARFASSQQRPPESAGSTCGAPTSVCLVRDVVDKSLIASNVPDCGLGTSAAFYGTPNSYTWTFNGTCGSFSLKVERNTLNPTGGNLVAPFDTSPYRVENTRITMIYPYVWQFNQIFKLLDGNANYLSSTITVTSTMQNLE